ncbi:hypothetical protein E3U43_011792 [Larimichthys crocea]|uniref:Uncharacterized protein n=1 Tax=Larimichthys crocea TaxID=215358 RepID=A0ACD3QMB9_LARCR|nr:hypothetical protein E3U43_011792 [Larimichthys crocea]
MKTRLSPPNWAQRSRRITVTNPNLTPPLPTPPLQFKHKSRSKHVRHASEPTTFIPISPPPHLQTLKEVDGLAVRSVAEPQNLSKLPGDEAPSLEACDPEIYSGTEHC